MLHLSLTVDTWTSEAVVASRYLSRLYRALGDDKQAYRAIQAGAPAAERAQRLGLSSRIAAMQVNFAIDNPDEVQGEAKAWKTLVESQAGLCSFHSMVEGHSKNALQGSRGATGKAFLQSLDGFRAAFPEPIAHNGIFEALQAAAGRCAETCLEGLGGEESPDVRSTVILEIHKNILEALVDAADLKTCGFVGSSSLQELEQ